MLMSEGSVWIPPILRHCTMPLWETPRLIAGTLGASITIVRELSSMAPGTNVERIKTSRERDRRGRSFCPRAMGRHEGCELYVRPHFAKDANQIWVKRSGVRRRITRRR